MNLRTWGNSVTITHGQEAQYSLSLAAQWLTHRVVHGYCMGHTTGSAMWLWQVWVWYQICWPMATPHTAAILQHLLVSQSYFFDLFGTSSSHSIEEKINIFTGIHLTNIFECCSIGHQGDDCAFFQYFLGFFLIYHQIFGGSDLKNNLLDKSAHANMHVSFLTTYYNGFQDHLIHTMLDYIQ